MLNSRQRRTLEAVFQRPVRADIRWDEIVSLLEACGANVSESSSGSRVRVELVGIAGRITSRTAARPTKAPSMTCVIC